MDNSSQTLELQIKAKAQEAKANVESLVKSLTNVENVLTNIYLELGSIEKKAESSINKATTNATKNVNQLKQATDKATSSTNKLNSALKNVFTFVGVKRVATTALGWMNEAIDYTEQLNLFNVVFDNTEKNGKQMFSELGKSALQFQYKMNEAFGTNKTQTLYMQGIFQSMGETVGIKDNYSAIMSETMTKLTYDLASLYNKTENATAEAIRAGVYAGQTKPLRSYGIDVTQSSLQPIVKELGITDEDGNVKSVKNMSQAEKEILRYIATLKQAKIAMGDFANTCESPSNQLKIFRQQLIETKVAFSSLFIGGLSSILPYVNAFLMVVKEVSKAIATMFGIELKDYNSGIASQEGIYDGIADSADNASKAVKELKRQTLGFDEIHNINENNNSGSGTSVSGGIDQRLLDAITGYDNGMDKVRMKATEIRDRIMDWLGFTKEIDPLTGEVSFKYNGIKTALKNIWKSFKDLNTQGKIFVGLGLYLVVSKLFDNVKKLNTISGSSGLLGLTKKLLSPMKSLYKSLNNVNFAHKTLTQGLSEGITNWSKSLTMSEKFRVSLVGILGLSTSMEGMKNAMKSVSDEGWNLSNSLQAVVSGIGGIASGAYIGSIFGPWGTVIGGASGAVLELIGAIDGYETASEKMIKSSEKSLETAQQNLQNYYDTKKAIEDSMNNELAFQDYNKTLLDELGQLVDANGKVKTGYEDRVNFILNELNSAYGTEYSIIDGTISGYEDLKKSIEDVIQTKKANIMLDAEEKNYKNAIQNQKQAWKDYNDAIKEYNKNNEKSNDLIDKKYELEKLVGTQAYRNYTYYSELTKETYKGQYAYNAITKDLKTYNEILDNNQKALNDNRTTFENYTNDIVFYEDLQTAVLSNNVEKQNQLIEERLNTITTANGEEKLSLSEQLEYYDDVANKKIEILKNNGVEITDEMIQQANAQKQTLIDNLYNQTKELKSGEVSNELAEAWYTLGEKNKDKFLEKFKELPDYIQTEIVSKMYEKGCDISSELQSGINQINPTITVTANTTGAENSIINFVSKLKSKLGGGLFSFGGSSSGGTRAAGGIYSNGSWKNIPQYANGGSPSHGTMFVAGEAGAEIVGHINGKTEVLNQSQIASAIYSAVYSAMSQFNGGGVAEINVHAAKDVIVETSINGIQQHIKQTGNLPFAIPTC